MMGWRAIADTFMNKFQTPMFFEKIRNEVNSLRTEYLSALNNLKELRLAESCDFKTE